MNILAIGAHPDDIEIGCGGLLLKAAKHGHRIFMYVLTRGGASGKILIRTEELKRSAKFIGADKLWIDSFEDTKLYPSNEIISRIEHVIIESRADIVYTHSISDTHHDHRAVAESTIEAGRYVPNILAYEIPVTKEFRPQVYYDISDVMNDKIKLTRIYSSQKDKVFIKSTALKGLAEYRALQSRLKPSITAVEAFEVCKIGFKDNFKLLDSNEGYITSQDNNSFWKDKNIIEYRAN